MNNSNEYNTRQEIVGSLLVIFFLLKSIILLAAGSSEIYTYISSFANNSDIVPRAQWDEAIFLSLELEALEVDGNFVAWLVILKTNCAQPSFM